MKPRTPRSARHLAWLRGLNCAWCGRQPPCEASHHGRRGTGIKASDLDAIPLCARCHAHHHGPRYAHSAPLPLVGFRRRGAMTVAAMWDFPTREWAAGYARGLRFRIALASTCPTEPSW